MSQLPYEILLRWKDDGTFSGGHTIRRDSITGTLSLAQPLGGSIFPWPDVLKEINSSALAATSDLTEKLTALQASHEELEAAHESISKELEEATKDETQKAVEAAEAKVAEAQAELALLQK